MQIGIAIIGVGRWGTHWVRNFANCPRAKVVAIIDRHPERRAACREKFELDETVVMASQWEDARTLDAIDAVAIATPAETHYELIRDALELGYHVLAEKPLTLNPSECVELTLLAEKKKLQLLVDHTYLFNPVVDRGREVVASGKLGELRYGYASRTHLGPVRHDVDALWDLAIHDICIFNHWLGETPNRVKANGQVWLQPNPGLADLVWVTLLYPSGFQADIHLCWLNPDKQRRLCVAGSRGTLIFDEMNSEAPLTVQTGYFEKEEGYFVPAGLGREVIAVEAAESLRRVRDRFLDDIETQTPSSFSSGWVGAELVQVLTCLSESKSQGGEWVAVPQTASKVQHS
ncbi:Gfo/Idh/MocA family protein [Lusitaniella coriacea]|uniref:Gfo/Idh/MocA family protein n=1 Tax=Lusitaniella coriacea TaxID=1983105 RepID=UPI003CFB6772